VRNPDAQMTSFQIITMGMILSVPMVLAGAYLIWNALRTTVTPEPVETTNLDG
jgi:phosphatidylglycerol:prolipoprotein diacylglycerol transferase